MQGTTEAEQLAALFRCERYLHLFPTGMPLRACLRRQLERQLALDGKRRPLPIEDWPAAKPYCAEECLLGRGNLAAARAAGVPAETCLKCGAAQVGSGSAAPCQGCPENEKQVPRGHLPPPGPGLSSRIWNGEAPDVPIGPPSGAQAASPKERRRAAEEPEEQLEQEDDHQEEPAEPAEEGDDMAKEKSCSRCGKKLRSDNTRGVCGQRCKPAAKAKDPAAGPAKAPVREVAPARRPTRPPAPKPAALLDLMDRAELAGASTRDLLALREALDDELRGRLSVHESELAALRAAVGGRAA